MFYNIYCNSRMLLNHDMNVYIYRLNVRMSDGLMYFNMYLCPV